jgi:hypothetical protein
MLNNWRSSVGKFAHITVMKFFNSNSRAFGHVEDHAAFVSDSLKQMHFIYKHPERAVSITYVYYLL